MILVVAESRGGELAGSALELAGAARALADGLGAEVRGLVLGHEVRKQGEAFAGFVDRVFVASHPELRDFRPEPWTRVVSAVAAEGSARAVLMADSRSGLSCSARVAARLNGCLLERLVELEVREGRIVGRRLAYLSRIVQTVRAERSPAVITLTSGAFPPATPSGKTGGVDLLELEDREVDVPVKVLERPPPSAASDEASVVVAGGLGVGGAEGFRTLVEPLAATLSAEVGATRPLVDAGLRPYREQIGQTGRTVTPHLYIALGISGAAQHLCGMRGSRVVVAINRDPNAPIFREADYGIIGDVRNVVPELRRAMEEIWAGRGKRGDRPGDGDGHPDGDPRREGTWT